MRYILTMLAALACALPVHAEIARSSAVRERFVRANPCPEPDADGGCSKWRVDHVHSLCAAAGSTPAERAAEARRLDAPWNMAWQRVAESREKDRAERAYCAWLRRLR